MSELFEKIREREQQMSAEFHIKAASELLKYDVRAANADVRIAKAHVHALLAIALNGAQTR